MNRTLFRGVISRRPHGRFHLSAKLGGCELQKPPECLARLTAALVQCRATVSRAAGRGVLQIRPMCRELDERTLVLRNLAVNPRYQRQGDRGIRATLLAIEHSFILEL
jgi:hypothetical protein